MAPRARERREGPLLSSHSCFLDRCQKKGNVAHSQKWLCDGRCGAVGAPATPSTALALHGPQRRSKRGQGMLLQAARGAAGEARHGARQVAPFALWYFCADLLWVASAPASRTSLMRPTMIDRIFARRRTILRAHAAAAGPRAPHAHPAYARFAGRCVRGRLCALSRRARSPVRRSVTAGLADSAED